MQNGPASVVANGFERFAPSGEPISVILPASPPERARRRLAWTEAPPRIGSGGGAGGDRCEGDREPAAEARRGRRALDGRVPRPHPATARHACTPPIGARPAHALRAGGRGVAGDVDPGR